MKRSKAAFDDYMAALKEERSRLDADWDDDSDALVNRLAERPAPTPESKLRGLMEVLNECSDAILLRAYNHPDVRANCQRTGVAGAYELLRMALTKRKLIKEDPRGKVQPYHHKQKSRRRRWLPG